jgi:hypothetical protein
MAANDVSMTPDGWFWIEKKVGAVDFYPARQPDRRHGHGIWVG